MVAQEDQSHDDHHHASLRERVAAVSAELNDVLAYGILLVVSYIAFWLAIKSGFEYGQPIFCTVALWVGSHLFGLLFSLVNLPPLLGMIGSGMLLRNALPELIMGLPPAWKTQIRAMALGMIFLRSGLELDLKVFKRVGPLCLRLLLVPGITEAIMAGTIGGHLIFGMPVLLGITMGFIQTGVGPAIVIQTMTEVQDHQLGTAKGIPSIVVGAASFDDMIAITGYSIFSSLALSSDKPLWEVILHGPIDLALGAVAGCIGAVFCSLTAVWNNTLKRVLVVFFTTMVLLFTLYHFEYRAGGALSALTLGMMLSIFWERGIHFFGVPGYLTQKGPGIGDREFTHKVEHLIGIFWRFVAQPLLFGIIGTLINFKTLKVDVIPKSLATVFIGVGSRIPATFLVMTPRSGLTWKERLFIAVSWTPKATVQAALSAQPLDIIKKTKFDSPQEKAEYLEYGEEILTTVIFAVLVCAPAGVLLVHFLARRLLSHDGESSTSDAEAATKKDEGEDETPTHLSRMPTLTRMSTLTRRPQLGRTSLVATINNYLSGTETGWVKPTGLERRGSGTLGGALPGTVGTTPFSGGPVST